MKKPALYQEDLNEENLITARDIAVGDPEDTIEWLIESVFTDDNMGIVEDFLKSLYVTVEKREKEEKQMEESFQYLKSDEYKREMAELSYSLLGETSHPPKISTREIQCS